MNIMICFEVSDKLEQVRKELSAKRYMSSWKVKRGRDEITFFLPSNALWKKGENMSPTKAKEDLKKSAALLGIKVIRAVAVTVGKFDGMTGTKYDSESVVVETAETSS